MWYVVIDCQAVCPPLVQLLVEAHKPTGASGSPGGVLPLLHASLDAHGIPPCLTGSIVDRLDALPRPPEVSLAYDWATTFARSPISLVRVLLALQPHNAALTTQGRPLVRAPSRCRLPLT